MPDSYGGTPLADSYYERLGVDPDADNETVKRASKLAKRAVHPDNNNSEQTTAEREFDRVTDAADALTDSDSRTAYDAFIDDQGPVTGTDRYEEWDTAGRPKPPAAWLSEPQSPGSSSTTTASQTNASTTRTADASTTGTANDTTSRTRTGTDRRTSNRGRSDEQRQAAAREKTTEAATGEATTANTATTRKTQETADTTPTGRPNTRRAPESVLSEDPEELYGKYVLDSEAAWGPREGTTQSATNGATGDATSSVVAAVVSRFVSPEIATKVDRLATVPKPWWLRAGIAIALLALAVMVGPIAERLTLLPLVALPRISLWLYPTLAAGITVAPGLVPLETSVGWLAAYAVLSTGYVLLGRWLRLT